MILSLGCIKRPFLDELLICKTEGATNRDQLTLCQQHSFLITHVNTEVNVLAERDAKLLAVTAAEERRHLATDPLYIAAEERRKQHLQDVAKEDKLLRAKAVKDAKFQAATIERDRVALLTPTEKRVDVAAKKLITSEKKRLRDENINTETAARRKRLEDAVDEDNMIV